MTIASEVNVKLDRAMEMLGMHPRMKASVRNDLSLLLNSVKNDVLAIEQPGTMSELIPSLEAKIKELTALVEQQATYIHNNIKPAPVKATTISFLSKEQPDAAFSVYAVNPEWLKQRLGDRTVTNAELEAIVRAEAGTLAQKQLNGQGFQIHISIMSALSVRFSIRSGGAFQGVNRLMGGGLFPGVLNLDGLADWFARTQRGGGMS